jgi:hypothetical protein
MNVPDRPRPAADVEPDVVVVLWIRHSRRFDPTLAPRRVKELLGPIGKTVNAIAEAKAREWFRNPHRETTSSSEFTPEERRLILSTLHPDNSASKERGEAAFKAFDDKVKTRLDRKEGSGNHRHGAARRVHKGDSSVE